MTILGFCDGKSLGTIVQTCRYFYVAGHQPELWRDLVLRRMSNQVIKEAGPSWKETYTKSLFLSSKNVNHTPMRVAGVYSENFYRLHSCRSFALPEAWMDTSLESVSRIPVEKMTRELFFEKYERPNIPLIVSGGAKSWKCFKEWHKMDYCLEHFKSRTFRATSGAAPLPASFSLDAYLNYCRSNTLEEAPLYLFDRTALEPNTHLWKDYMQDLQQSCPWWDPHSREHDLFKLFGEGKRPDHTWLIVGPRRSGSVFHIDPNCTHAWNAAVVGRKRWLFYPPGVTPPGVHPTPDGDEVTLPLSLGEWLLTFWDEHEERKRSAPVAERPLECTAMPGDVLFVPHGWWHAVINLDELNVAITHNYVSFSNLPNVLRFLDEKLDHISGCRDRTESIKPEHLGAEFEKRLLDAYPNELKEAKSIQDWTCAAWSSRRECSQSSPPETESSVHSGESVMTKAKAEDSSSFSFSFL